MSRPQKYTDSEIAAAAQALIAEGEEINPMRVRMRLGGGNVHRIKAVIATMPARPEQRTAPATRLPDSLRRELQHLSSEASHEILSVLAKYWASMPAGSSAPIVGENVGLRQQIEGLEIEVVVLSDKVAVAEHELNEKDQVLKQVVAQRDELARNLASLQSALRNAESDFRAAQRTIDNLDRNRREDREQVRDLQKRIEDLIGELAGLKAKMPGTRPKGRTSSTGS